MNGRLLAELEIWHSRPIAPTRRVAVGHTRLPVQPAPGHGGLLLGAIVGAFAPDLDPDLLDELHRLLGDLEAGRRIPQPRLRHRFQVDRHGLGRSRHRLLDAQPGVELDLDSEGSPASQVLGAAYAAGALPRGVRRDVMRVLHRGLNWRGGTGPELLRHLAGGDRVLGGDASGWALQLLGFDLGASPGRRDVQRRFRDLLREAHPDSGGERAAAAARIADLSEARRILLSTST